MLLLLLLLLLFNMIPSHDFATIHFVIGSTMMQPTVVFAAWADANASCIHCPAVTSNVSMLSASVVVVALLLLLLLWL
jgi:hypothetical protein